MRNSERFGLAAAALSAGQAGFALIWAVLRNAALPGFTRGTTLVMSLVMIAMLAVATIGLARRRIYGWAAGLFASVGSVGYGVMVAAGGNRLGVVHMVLGLAMLFCLGKSIPAFRAERGELGPATA